MEFATNKLVYQKGKKRTFIICAINIIISVISLWTFRTIVPSVLSFSLAIFLLWGYNLARFLVVATSLYRTYFIVVQLLTLDLKHNNISSLDLYLICFFIVFVGDILVVIMLVGNNNVSYFFTCETLTHETKLLNDLDKNFEYIAKAKQEKLLEQSTPKEEPPKKIEVIKENEFELAEEEFEHILEMRQTKTDNNNIDIE